MSASNVVQLPDSMHREWRACAQALHDGLVGMGCTDAEAVACVPRLRDIFMKYGAPKTVGINVHDVDASQAAIEGWINPMVTGLMCELLIREVKLYRLRG